MTDLIAALPPLTDTTRQRLHDRLIEKAEANALLDVAYRTVSSSVGTLLLAATTVGLVRVAYATEEHDAVLAELATRISPRILAAPARLDAAARQLDDYFAGRRTRFDLALDLRLAHGFRRAVLTQLCLIEYGRTASYGRVAAAAGSPRAVRAVGTACARNPLPIVLPCHRVVRSDGQLGDYVGGASAKRVLLDLESPAGINPADARL